jgi:hypothetical protein
MNSFDRPPDSKIEAIYKNILKLKYQQPEISLMAIRRDLNLLAISWEAYTVEYSSKKRFRSVLQPYTHSNHSPTQIVHAEINGALDMSYSFRLSFVNQRNMKKTDAHSSLYNHGRPWSRKFFCK